MSKAKKYEVIGIGENCPKCSKPMQRREHKNILDKQRNAPYYFKEWDYCTNCNHLQHYEWCKVFNDNKAAKLYRQVRQPIFEHNQRVQFLIDKE